MTAFRTLGCLKHRFTRWQNVGGVIDGDANQPAEESD